MESTVDLDPITFEVLRSSFSYIAMRMSKTLQRTAFSPILYDMLDFSNGLFNKDGQLIGQAENCPAHLGSMHFSAEECFKKFGKKNLKAGDILVVNDPYRGGSHTPDITFVMPAYLKDNLLGFVVNRGHWTDLGGAAGGASVTSQHIVEDGIVIPPTKLFQEGSPNEDLIDIIKNNSRLPQYIEGDLWAHVGALKTGERALQEIVGKYGQETVQIAMKETLNYAERRTRKAIKEIPDGEYIGERYIDCDGVTNDSIIVRVKLSVNGDQIMVDFTGTGSINRGSVNSPIANTYSAVYTGLKSFLDPSGTTNAGFYRPISIKLPENTWVNSKWPASTRVCTTVGLEAIADAIWIALSKAIPGKTIGCLGTGGAIYIGGNNPNTNGYFMLAELPSGGWGGSPYGDGMSATYSRAGNVMDLAPEIAEAESPVYCERRELLIDSGGPGKYRGGLGERETWRFKVNARASQMGDNFKHPACGVQGGKSGGLGKTIVNFGEKNAKVIAGYDGKNWKRSMFSNYTLEAGETYTYEAPGGGGWGNPLERDPELVRDDLIDGFVSFRSVKDDYGVILGPETYEIDYESTRKLRQKKRKGGKMQ